MEVKDKVIMIAGASSGIGKSLAQLLSAKSAKVVLLGRRGEKLTEIEAELKAAKHAVRVVKTDITDRNQVDNAVRLTLEAYGKIDVVINNAGVGYFTNHESFSPEVRG
ncbi:MAG TPA: hypothetical protein DD730_14555 [Desulfosporosinus sp.]|jgi:NADP-dependent 3-hydroxy acid dehydrogenase YdfG|nr:hypothetical protein [Desulfosporosinus sp.]